MNDPTKKEHLMMQRKMGRIFGTIFLSVQDSMGSGEQVGKLALGVERQLTHSDRK